MLKTYQLTNPLPLSSECDISIQYKAENRLKAAQKAFRAMSKRMKKQEGGSKSIPFYFSLAKVDGENEPLAKDSFHFEGTKEYTTKGNTKLTIRCYTPKKGSQSQAQKIQIGSGKYNVQNGGAPDQKGKSQDKHIQDYLGYNPYTMYSPYALAANNYLFYNPLWYGDVFYSNAFFNGYPFLGLTYPLDFPIHYQITP